MPYLEDRNNSVRALHTLYSPNIPEYLLEFLEVPEVLRLNGIEQNAGIDFSGFNIYKYRYSMLDHSLGVALILNSFVSNKKQVIAALLHDIDVPAFLYSSYYIDESNFSKDDIKLNSYDIIVGSNKLFEYFFKNEVDINDMCDYTKYPLAYNVRPHLCAHRLEYFLHTAYLSGMYKFEEIKEMYDDLFVAPNEDNMPEFCFKTPEIAKKFCELTIKCGEKYRSYEAKMAMKFISDTLATMIRREVITRKDLYTYSDRVIMDMGLSCSDKRISDRWKYLPELNKVYTKFNPVKGKNCFKLSADLRYVDPLVRFENSGFNLRLSDIDKKVKEEIDEFLNSDTDLYMYGDYED